jgi:hypothetical protein
MDFWKPTYFVIEQIKNLDSFFERKFNVFLKKNYLFYHFNFFAVVIKYYARIFTKYFLIKFLEFPFLYFTKHKNLNFVNNNLM